MPAIKKRILSYLIILLTLLTLTGCFAGREYPPAPLAERGADWAKPVPNVNKDDIPNLHKVSQTLYRGGRTTEAGYLKLKEMGVQTIISLRYFHNARLDAKKAGLKYIRIPTHAWLPIQRNIKRFLREATDKKNGVVFVHCKHGSDRTGMMVAAYRIAIQGWTVDKALDEMRRGGFGFHEQWGNITRFMKLVNWERMKR